MPACATTIVGLSTSVIESVPPVESAALVSFNATTAELRIAASFVPLIVTFTEVADPSAEATAKVSDTDSPTFRPSNALFPV